MALIVNFWSYSKRDNSTAIPTGAPDRSLSCSLKSDSGVLSPILEIGLGMTFNPSSLNYAQIPTYNRYYRVTDWQWAAGLWICSLQVDVLSSFRAEIGATSKYVIRAAADYNPDIIDNFYPAEEHVAVSFDTYSFPWYDDFTNGAFILGVISGSGTGLAGTTEYYILTPPELKDFMTYLFPTSTVNWSSLNGMEESIYKSIYDPLRFIVSCKYFPFGIGGIETDVPIEFGNFVSTKYAEPLSKPAQWPVFAHDYSLPSDWLSRDARDRSEPFCDLAYWLNPFGVLPISPADFTLTDTVRVRITPDLISGEATIQIFALMSSGTEILVTQQTGILGFDVNLEAINRNMAAAVGAVVTGSAQSAREVLTGSPPLSALSVAGDAFVSLHRPTISYSSRGTPSVAMLDGSSRLYSRRHTFPAQKVSEFGRPLYDDRVINTLPGFIRCGDGDIAVPGYAEEISRIGEYLTGGFFYE